MKKTIKFLLLIISCLLFINDAYAEELIYDVPVNVYFGKVVDKSLINNIYLDVDVSGNNYVITLNKSNDYTYIIKNYVDFSGITINSVYGDNLYNYRLLYYFDSTNSPAQVMISIGESDDELGITDSDDDSGSTIITNPTDPDDGEETTSKKNDVTTSKSFNMLLIIPITIAFIFIFMFLFALIKIAFANR